jgi:hypothetical protein
MATDKKKNKNIRQEKNNERLNHGTTSASCSSDESFETFVLIENRTTNNNDESIHPLHRQGILFLSS